VGKKPSPLGGDLKNAVKLVGESGFSAVEIGLR